MSADQSYHFVGLCHACEDDGWPLYPDDIYCCNCGTPVQKVEIKMLGVPVYESTGIAQERVLRISNAGQLPVQIEEIPLDTDLAQWLKFDEKAFPFVLAQIGDHRDISLTINTDLAANTSASGELVISSPSGLNASLPIVVSEMPDFTLNVPHEIYMEPDGSGICPAELEVMRGDLRIQNVEVVKDGGWIGDLENIREVFIGKTFPNRSETQVAFDIAEGVDRGKAYFTEFAFTLEGVAQPVNKTITITLIDTPVEVQPAHGTGLFNIFLGHREHYKLNIKSGVRSLDIIGVDRLPTWMHLISKMPMSLKGKSKEDEIVFLIDTYSMRDKESRDLNVSIKIAFKGQREKTGPFDGSLSVPIQIRANHLEPHEEVVGIDVGTSRSCIAAYTRPSFKLLELDAPGGSAEGYSGTLIPSEILYTGAYGENFDYVTGYEALNRSDELFDAYFVAIKRHLGKDETIATILGSYLLVDDKPFEYSPKRIVKDVLWDLIQAAEKQLKKRIKKCVFCHPARFSARQILDLRWAIHQLGFEEDAVFSIDEASAAALDYIIKRNQELTQVKQAESSYTMALYDFGGGTLDMTICRVTTSLRDRKRIVHIQTLGVDGDRQLGGEDMTQALVEILIAECRSVLVKDSRDNNYAIYGIDTAEEDASKRSARYNVQDIRRSAEGVKIALSSDDKASVSFFLVLKDNDNPSDDLEKEFNLTITREQFEAQIRAQINRSVDLLKSLFNDVKSHGMQLDVVVRSGQSSQIPLVKSCLEEAFPDARHERVEDMKGCVALGACRYGMSEIGTSQIELQIENFATRTNSRLGIEVWNDAFEPRFREVIKRGVKIPDDSWGDIKETLSKNMVITVLENFRQDNLLYEGEFEEVDTFSVEFPDATSEEDLAEGTIKLSLAGNEILRIEAVAGQHKHQFHSQRTVSF
jgi:molecular chaperone DnaK (HSP70)